MGTARDRARARRDDATLPQCGLMGSHRHPDLESPPTIDPDTQLIESVPCSHALSLAEQNNEWARNVIVVNGNK